SLLARSGEISAQIALVRIDPKISKAVNDTYGHWKGDEVLTWAAQVLKGALRESDVVGRLGGDEFAVCIGAPPDVIRQRAAMIAGRIVERIAQLGGGVGCSVGISLRPLGRDG